MRIEYINDENGSFQEAHGSDGRLNVSSRSDERMYYNSRDKSQTYSLVFDDASCTSGDFNVALCNDSTDGKHMVLHSIGVNADAAVTMKLHLVTGTAGGGAVATLPLNLNRAGTSNAASATASTVVNSDSSPISGLTSAGVFDHAFLQAGGHEEFRIQDSIRLGQGQTVAIEADTATAGTRVAGVIFFYYE
tara:strand:- start:166 stop:738 length:573 start_codon:yes stop_codon:yes gene_type:complete